MTYNPERHDQPGVNWKDNLQMADLMRKALKDAGIPRQRFRRMMLRRVLGIFWKEMAKLNPGNIPDENQ